MAKLVWGPAPPLRTGLGFSCGSYSYADPVTGASLGVSQVGGGSQALQGRPWFSQGQPYPPRVYTVIDSACLCAELLTLGLLAGDKAPGQVVRESVDLEEGKLGDQGQC